jgi:hypothetical protein
LSWLFVELRQLRSYLSKGRTGDTNYATHWSRKWHSRRWDGTDCRHYWLVARLRNINNRLWYINLVFCTRLDAGTPEERASADGVDEGGISRGGLLGVNHGHSNKRRT